jgi:glutamate---cysteine ligase / carboxylate-amine ligase
MAKARNFTVGIEEEYLLVDRESRDLIREAPTEMLARCRELLGDQVTTEFLQSQIEIGTKVCGSIAEARADLSWLRGTVAKCAADDGMGLIAASTHPFALWSDQKPTEKDRYLELAQDMQGVVRRLMICGMHVHVCVADPDERVDLMNQVAYFLPHMLALSTSSPYWGGDDTGLASYRLTVFDNMPRTGLPGSFDSWAEYERHVNMLVRTGVIEDTSKIWWDIRPSSRFPTLEMRICDVCTRQDDAVAIAALFQCLIHMLHRLRRMNQRWRTYAQMLVAENRWRAQRYGIDEGLIDFGKAEVVPYADLLDEIIELTLPDADALGCTNELLRAREILARGTGAHRQRRAHVDAVASGASPEEAMKAVVDMLIAETVAGL